jgi:DNA-directed RNA polymerase specialized sigma24 family protein
MTTEPWWETSPAISAMREAARAEMQRWLDLPDDCAPCDEPDPVVLDMWNGNSKRQLVAAREDLARARTRYDEAVLHARTVGLSWQEIGALLGVSRKQLHRRYRRLSPTSRGHTP